MIILKSESKPDERGEERKNDDKNMVQIHDEQLSIQITTLHRDIYIHKNTAQTSTVITNNGSKNSKCRPESDTISEKRQQQCEPFK